MIKLTDNKIAEQQRSELYMRLYAFMAQDWVDNKDMKLFSEALINYITELENKLSQLSKALQQHKHKVPGHTHPIPLHTHTIPPHLHIAPPYGGPTSPIPLTTMPGGNGVTNMNTVFDTLVPNDTNALSWKKPKIPDNYANKTGATTNIEGNTMTQGVAVIGDTASHNRRTMILPDAAVPIIPKYLRPNVI